MPLAINSNMLGQFSDWLLSLLYLTISFLLSSPKTLSFSRRPPNLTQKNDDLGLVHRWIVVKFEHYVRSWEFWYHVWAERNTFRIVAFSFPAETQNGLSKIMIQVLLTIGFSWNLDMLFENQFLTLSPLGFTRYWSWKEKKESHEDSTSGGFNPFSVSLTLGNSIRAVGGRTGGISGNR